MHFRSGPRLCFVLESCAFLHGSHGTGNGLAHFIRHRDFSVINNDTESILFVSIGVYQYDKRILRGEFHVSFHRLGLVQRLGDCSSFTRGSQSMPIAHMLHPSKRNLALLKSLGRKRGTMDPNNMSVGVFLNRNHSNWPFVQNSYAEPYVSSAISLGCAPKGSAVSGSTPTKIIACSSPKSFPTSSLGIHHSLGTSRTSKYSVGARCQIPREDQTN